MLDNLESFLSTFQKDLAAVAGQISELQDKSKDIDGRLKSRKVFTIRFYYRHQAVGISQFVAES